MVPLQKSTVFLVTTMMAIPWYFLKVTYNIIVYQVGWYTFHSLLNISGETNGMEKMEIKYENI